MKISTGIYVCNKRLIIERINGNLDIYEYDSVKYCSVIILQGPVMHWIRHVHLVPLHLSMHIKPSGMDIVTLPLWVAPIFVSILTYLFRYHVPAC
jgi:hypothetical protein